jgi:hypothetical protein
MNLSSESVPPEVKDIILITPTQRRALEHPSRTGSNLWGDIDRAILAFRKIHSEYDYYWIVENDVEFSGRWSELFNAFADNPSDLLCSNVHRQGTNPTWNWWESLVWPHDPKPELIRGFFPFARLSAQAIDTIIAAGQKGIDGFYEVAWPTVLHHYALVIEDIGGDGPFVQPANVNRWYTSTLTRDFLSPGTFVYRPTRFRPGREPSKLWHPVKPSLVDYVKGTKAANWIRSYLTPVQ